jgi:hypothetical protein
VTFLFGLLGVMVELGNLLSAAVDFFQGKGFSIKEPIGATVTWFANPLLFLSWIAVKRNNKIALKLSLASTVLILSFLLFQKVINNEAGTYAGVTGYKAGYWLWLSSALMVVLGSIWLLKKNSQLETNVHNMSFNN